MKEIDTKVFFRGVNARRGNVSVTSPSSMPPSEDAGSLTGAFSIDAFQNDAFSV